MTDKIAKPADLANVTATQDEDFEARAKKKTFETVDLMTPITRGETTIDTLTIRKPKAGELRGGLSLADFIGTDIAAILKVLPRITEPPLTDEEAANLDLADLSEIGGTIRGFFMTRAERAMMDKMIAEQQPKT